MYMYINLTFPTQTSSHCRRYRRTIPESLLEHWISELQALSFQF